MNSFEILNQEIGTYFPLEAIKENWHSYTMDIGNRTLKNYVYYISELDRIILFSICTKLKLEDLSPSFSTIETVINQIESINWEVKTEIEKIENLQFNDSEMDAMMILPSEKYKIGLFSDKELANRTTIVFPIYHFEFSGNETAEEIDAIREVSVYALDWKREPAPKMLIRFDSPKTKMKITGKIPSFYKYSSFKIVILDETLVNSFGFVELTNYLGESIRIDSVQGGLFTIKQENTTINTGANLSATQKIVHEFLHK
jgi:hypothetical protein